MTTQKKTNLKGQRERAYMLPEKIIRSQSFVWSFENINDNIDIDIDIDIDINTE